MKIVEGCSFTLINHLDKGVKETVLITEYNQYQDIEEPFLWVKNFIRSRKESGLDYSKCKVGVVYKNMVDVIFLYCLNETNISFLIENNFI